MSCYTNNFPLVGATLQIENPDGYLSGLVKILHSFFQQSILLSFQLFFFIIILYSFIFRHYISIQLPIHPQIYLSILLFISLFIFRYYIHPFCFFPSIVYLLIHFRFLYPSTNISIFLPTYPSLINSLFSLSTNTRHTHLTNQPARKITTHLYTVNLSIHLQSDFFCLYASLELFLSVFSSPGYLSTHPSIHLSSYPFIYAPIHMYIPQPTSLTIYL